MHIRKHIEKIFKRFWFTGLMGFVILLFSKCESKDRFYRPNLPEQLCSIGIIDADDSKEYISFPDFPDDSNYIHSIAFEKSYQVEYPDEINDSLKDFSFTISSPEKELFSYKNKQPKYNRFRFNIPDSVKFTTYKKYYLEAKEQKSSEIYAEATVAEPPSKPELISAEKENIILPKHLVDWNLDTIKSVRLRFSFNNNSDHKQFYALILDGKHHWMTLPELFSCYLDFSVLESNSPGFSAVLYGIYLKHYPSPMTIYGIIAPVYAYFIDGSKIPGNKCDITLTTQFRGPYSDYRGIWKHDQETYSSVRVKLVSIPEELYLFEKSLYTYYKEKSDPFSEPVYLNGNIKGGNGVFAICRSSELIINFNPPY